MYIIQYGIGRRDTNPIEYDNDLPADGLRSLAGNTANDSACLLPFWENSKNTRVVSVPSVTGEESDNDRWAKS